MAASLFEQFGHMLAGHKISLPDELVAKYGKLDDEVLGNLLLEGRQGGRFSQHQEREIKGGRAEQLVCGDYVIREAIGSGAQAEVFKANHVHMRRVDAIKVIRRDVLNNLPEAERRRTINRFDQGVRAAARLDHPNIVRTHSFDHRLHLMAMEFVDGPDLDTRSKQIDLSEKDAVEFILQAARGLTHAHANRVIHRDIKPRNLMFDESAWSVKISDWGMARIESSNETTSSDSDDDDRQTQRNASRSWTGDESQQSSEDRRRNTSSPTSHLTQAVSDRTKIPRYSLGSTRLTQPGDRFGTVCFMSPEQAEDTFAVDRRTDVYSLGCTLYTILTRQPIYKYATETLTMLAHCDRNIPVPSLREECGVSERLDAVFRRMVAKELSERYDSMTKVVAALEECVKDRVRPAAVEAAAKGMEASRQ